MRFEIGARREEGLVGRNERKAEPVGQIEERRLRRPLRGQSVPLDFDVEPLRKKRRERLEPGFRRFDAPVSDEGIEPALRPARERDDVRCIARKIGERQRRRLAGASVEMRARAKPHQIEIARARLGDQHQIAEGALFSAGRAFRAFREFDGDLRARQALEAGLRRLLGKLERREEIVRVGDADGRLRILLGEIDEARDAKRPFAQREGGVHVEMHESGV